MKNLKSAPERLRDALLPRATKMAAEDPAYHCQTPDGISVPIGQVAPYARIENVSGVEIYQTPAKDGWIADILLRNVPDGMSDAFGTAIAEPLRTRAEAEDCALHLLAITIVNSAKSPAPEPNPTRVFVWGDATCSISAAMYEAVSTDKLFVAVPIDDRAVEARRLLGLLHAKLFAGKSVSAVIDAGVDSALLWSAMILALSAGILRWPERQYGSPATLH